MNTMKPKIMAKGYDNKEQVLLDGKQDQQAIKQFEGHSLGTGTPNKLGVATSPLNI